MTMPHLPAARTAAAILFGCMTVASGAGGGRAMASGPGPGPGEIRGRVELPRLPAMTEARPSPAAMGAPMRHTPEPRPAVIFLESAPRGAFEPDEQAHARMDQRDETFVPHVLAITVGTTVDFPNSDVKFHNVFSLSKTKSFDLGRYARGQSKSVRFDRPGVVQVFCEIHSHMSAYILVLAHRYFALSDGAGRYAIEGVPPGTYTLSLWYEGSVRESRTVTVPDGAGAGDADFVVR
jgi:plastocyanin